MQNEALGSPTTDSLFDFLYVDKVRVASWFAQLFNDGVLTGLKNSSFTTEGNFDSLSGGIPSVMKGTVSSTDGITDGLERTYNTEWSLPLTLLDELDKQKFIHRDVSDIGVGSLVLVGGHMQLTDVGMLQKVWSPVIKIMSQDLKVTHQNKANVHQLKSLMDSFGDALRAMPPEPQVYIKTDTGTAFWASLQPEHMIVNASTLALAHGSFMQGNWHVLAVLDALPSRHDTKSMERISTSDMSETMAEVLNLVRKIVGRDEQAYAITPILMFRESRPMARSD